MGANTEAGNVLEADYPEVYEQLASMLHEILEKRGIRANDTRNIPREFAERVRANLGGGLVYIPSGLFQKKRRRNAEIFNKFTGTNTLALAREYGVSVQTIYRIIKRMRGEQTKRGQ
jgi:Mor family transcriptional regulator